MPEEFADYHWAMLATLKAPEMAEARRALGKLRMQVRDPPVQEFLRAVWAFAVLDCHFEMVQDIRNRHRAETRLFAALDALPDLPPWVDTKGLAQARAAHAEADPLTRLATGRELHPANVAACHFSELARIHLGQPALSLSVELANALYGATLNPESVKKLKNTAP